jgi:DNA-binding NarL/FixJ family response regulator
MIKIKIVEDLQSYAEALESKLEASKIATVMGRYKSGAEFMASITGAHCVPDVLLIDIELPDCKGTDLSVQLLKQYPGLKIILLTSHDSYGLILRAISTGIHGYILKSASWKDIIGGIQAVIDNKYKDVYLCETASRVIRGKNTPKKMPIMALPVMHCIAAGFTDEQTAVKLFRSKHTINDIVKDLIEDCEVMNRTALVVKAIDDQLINMQEVRRLRDELDKIDVETTIRKNAGKK